MGKLKCLIPYNCIPYNCITVDDFFVLDKTASNSPTRTNNKSHARKADKTTNKPTPHHSSMKVSLDSLFLHSLGDNITTMVYHYIISVHHYIISVHVFVAYRKGKIVWVSEQGRGKDISSVHSLVMYTTGNGSNSMERMQDI